MKVIDFCEAHHITPYEFDKIIIERHGQDLFYHDKNGNPSALNKEAYRIAAKRLLKELEGDNK